MKKILILLSVGLLVLAGCGSKGSKEKIEEKTYSIGTVIQNDYSSSTEEGVSKFEANVTYTTVVLEGDKIAYLVIDTAQNDVQVQDGEAISLEAKGTKKERLEDYGMSKVPGSKGEWYEQIIAFQKYAVGKTVEELKAGDPASDLSSSVSIHLGSFVEGVELAAANAVEVQNVARVANASITGDSKFEDDKAEIATTVAAVATNLKGEVQYVFIDESQAKAEFVDGEFVIDETSKVTKGDKKEAYGMSAAGMTEWYLQVEDIKEFVMNKNQDAVKAGQDDADLSSSVSIYKGSFFMALDKALTKTKNK